MTDILAALQKERNELIAQLRSESSVEDRQSINVQLEILDRRIHFERNKHTQRKFLRPTDEE